MPAAVAALVAAGCRQPVEIPSTDVKVVEAYGVKLDESATPRQVAYALLRAIRDDVESAQAGDRDGQKRAFRTTFSLGAFSEIEKRLARGLGDGKEDSLGETRDRRIHDVIYHWAPIVAHYVPSFDLDETTAVGRMKVLETPNATSTCIVVYDVAHDPAASDPAKRQPAMIEITLTRERSTGGAQEFWRVAKVAFRGSQAKAASRPAAQNALSPIPMAPMAPIGASQPAGR